MKEEKKQELYERARELLSQQNFTAAVVAGALAVPLGAAAYGLVPYTFRGFAAAGVGVIVGLPMGFLGRGIATKFAVMAGVYTILCCVLGNAFGAVLAMPKVNSGSVTDTLSYYPLSEIIERAASNVSIGDLVYWLVAVFCAVYLAKRPLSRSDRLAIGVFESHVQQQQQ